MSQKLLTAIERKYYIYIATTAQYQSKYEYIIGHTGNLIHHLQRLNYNRPIADSYRYIKHWNIDNIQNSRLLILEYLSNHNLHNDVFFFESDDEAIQLVENAIKTQLIYNNDESVTTCEEQFQNNRLSIQLNEMQEKNEMLHMKLGELQKQTQLTNMVLASIASRKYDTIHCDAIPTTLSSTQQLYSLRKTQDNVLWIHIKVENNESTKRKRITEQDCIIGEPIAWVGSTNFWSTVQMQNYYKLTYGVEYKDKYKMRFEILTCAQLNDTFNIMQLMPNNFPFYSFDDFVQKCFIGNEWEIFQMMQKCHENNNCSEN